MKPNRAARTVLKYARSKAKMYEFRLPEEHHIAIPRDPRVLFSLAVAILGDLAAAIADEFVPSDPLAALNGGVPEYWDEWDFDTDSLLNFAATFFDAYLNSRLDDDIAPEFSLLAAAAYYIGHSVGSATVVVKNTPPPSSDIEGGTERLVYAVLANQLDPIDDANVATNEVLSALRAFFLLEDDAAAVADACENLREQVYDNGTARELLYADLASAICALKVRAAARTYVTATSGLPLNAWRPALLKESFPIELWPAQQQICDAGVLQGRSVVIQMPTSAGKTRATELIIRSAILSDRTSLAVIVAPFRSLCHDIRTDLAKAFLGEDLFVTEATESYQVDITFGDELDVKPTVLIVTPEKLLYLLRRDSELAAKIGLIIYDEGHQFEGMTRGPTYELLLSTLRMSLDADTQKILISAVIGNAEEIASWLIGEPNVVRGDGLLPTTKSLAFATWDKVLGQLETVTSKALRSLSDQSVALPALAAWCSEATFADIFQVMSAEKVKVGRNNIRVEDVVALCENAFAKRGHRTDDWLFPSRSRAGAHIGTRQYARLVDEWVGAIDLDPGRFGTHSLRRTKVSLIYKKTGNLRACQLLLGHGKLESTVRYLGIEVDDALEISEQIDL